MAGHSRPKDGVASLAYVPAIHALLNAEVAKSAAPVQAGGLQIDWDSRFFLPSRAATARHRAHIAVRLR
jgi:hypothetical protein